MKDFLYSPDPDPDHAAKPRKKTRPRYWTSGKTRPQISKSVNRKKIRSFFCVKQVYC